MTHPGIDPVALQIGPLAIHWYGLMYLLAFLSAWWLARYMARRGLTPLREEQADDLIFYGALGVVIGGRCGYVLFYNFDQFLADPLWLLRVWEGGMSFHGGFLGVILATLWYARRIGLRAGQMMNVIAPIVPPGLGFGRLGNFIGQELWGRPADMPWAMVFPADPLRLARHPSQLYQAALEGLLLFLIVYWFARKPRPDWAVGAMFALCYGVFRFIVEFFREPDSHIGFDALGWMTRGQLLSLPMIAVGLVVLWLAMSGRTAGPGPVKGGKS